MLKGQSFFSHNDPLYLMHCIVYANSNIFMSSYTYVHMYMKMYT